jgi:hypothetical protein
MWPPVPAPYAALTGQVLAEGVKHLSLGMSLPPAWSAQLILQASTESTAGKLAEVAQIGLSEAGRLVVAKSTTDETFLPVAATVGQFVQLLTPTVDESRLVIDLRHNDERVAALSKLLHPSLISAALERSRQNVRLQRFKQLALTMLNFESAYGHFPASAAIRDKEGRPLLSWRVATLVFYDGPERELYFQFHHDEPWDSPHNSQLIEKMPELYYDPAQPRLGRQGKTTFQVPVGTETAFLPAEQTEVYTTKVGIDGIHLGRGVSLAEITDGTSNTIALVDTAPSEAVIWTKPDDWDVDLADPHRGLTAEGIRNFVAARCDGSVHLVPMDMAADKLRALLTRAGREAVD